nr:HNH endonuclease signature motif containing protein [Myceligenerans indicum]
MQGPMFDGVGGHDGFGFPLAPPDHTESELAAILAANPANDPELAAELAARDGIGPDGQAGEVVDPVDLLLEDVARLAPGPLLAGRLRGFSERGGTTPSTTPSTTSPAAGSVVASTAGGVTDGPATDAAPLGTPLGTLDGAELRQVVAGWERLISWARGEQARVARELIHRVDDPLSRDSVAGEISGELHVTTNEAWQIAMRAEGTGRYPALADALGSGTVDAKKADTFLRAGADLTPGERAEAITDLLPYAPRRTWKWISEQLNARAATLHGARARRRDVTDRCNVWAEQAGPGRGRIVADLPVTDAAMTFNAVQAAAKALKDTPGENRPLGALRAAAFTALVTGRVVVPCPDDAAGGSADHPRGSDVHTGGPEADAPVTPPDLVEPRLDTDLVPVPEDPQGLHLTAPAPATDPGTGAGAGAGAGAAPGTLLRVIEVPATVQVTVAASTLLDPADMTPGMIEGLGPIPADDAARIAADGTWRRLLTDPVSGVLRDYSTRTYAPGATLRAAVTARDRTCRFPGCDRPAVAGGKPATDLDHLQPFDKDHRYLPGEPGQTRAENLHPLCRRHHNVKTHANWRVTRDPATGVTRWTAPTGTVTAVEPTAVDPVVRYAHARGLTIAQPPGEPATTRRSGVPASGPRTPRGGTRRPDPRPPGPGRPPF